MKWMLIVLIFDVGPVKTDLIFNSLSECLDAEMRMRAAYAMEHNAQIKGSDPDRAQFVKDLLLSNRATCIPRTASPD